MNPIYRFNVTLKTPGIPDKTISIVAKSPAQAKEKAWARWGLPFIDRNRRMIAHKLEKITIAPLLMNEPSNA